MKHVLALIFVTFAAVRPASAQLGDLADRARSTLASYNIDEEVMKRIAAAMVGRVRRSIAIGPHVGGFGLIDAKDSASGGGISFGLGFYRFDVPSGLNLREVIKERVKAEVMERLKNGGGVDARQLVRDVIDKVIADVLDESYGSQKWPPPKMSVILEGQTTFGDADGFGGRLAFGYGISKLSVGVSAAVASSNDRTSFLFGPELSVRLLPIGQKRTPVFDLFGRVEFAARDGFPIHVAVGGRLLLDLI